MVVRISPTKRNAANRLKFGFLPQEIVERIASGVDFGDHLVEVRAKLVQAYFLLCRDEYARGVLLRYPRVLVLFKRVVFGPFRLKGELIILLMAVCVNLVENDEYRLVYRPYVA